MAAADRVDITHSAVRAFLGAIRPSFRRVAATATGTSLRVSVLIDQGVDPETLEDIREDVSVAATEILADFPAETRLPLDELVEDVRLLAGPLPEADAFAEGLIYQRWERRS